MNSEDAADCKEVSRDITNLDRTGWAKSAESLCYHGIKAKFTQNDHLLEKLLDTGDKILVEASYDGIWRTGQPLGSRDCLCQTKWKSISILGKILMRIRNDLKGTPIDDTGSEILDAMPASDITHFDTTEQSSS